MNHSKTLLSTVLFLAACADPYAPTAASEGETSSGSPAASRSGVLSVTLDVGDADTSRFACVFVMGRRKATDPFPELVQRLEPGPFPLTFELTAKDLMGAGSMRGPWHISARLDHDGDAPFAKGDLQGSTEIIVGDGVTHATLTLDTMVEADAVVSGMLDTSMGAHGVAGGGGIPGSASGGLPAGHPAVGQPADPHAGHNHAPGEGHPEAAPVDPHAGHDHAPGEGHDEMVQLEPVDDGLAVQVRVSLGEGVTPPAGHLYVFARTSATAKGMPLAVKRVPGPAFPVTLSLGLNDMPMAFDNAAELLGGTLFLSASLDADGDVATKQPHDLVGGPQEATRDGTNELVLSLRGEP